VAAGTSPAAGTGTSAAESWRVAAGTVAAEAGTARPVRTRLSSHTLAAARRTPPLRPRPHPQPRPRLRLRPLPLRHHHPRRRPLHHPATRSLRPPPPSPYPRTDPPSGDPFPRRPPRTRPPPSRPRPPGRRRTSSQTSRGSTRPLPCIRPTHSTKAVGTRPPMRRTTHRTRSRWRSPSTRTQRQSSPCVGPRQPSSCCGQRPAGPPRANFRAPSREIGRWHYAVHLAAARTDCRRPCSL